MQSPKGSRGPHEPVRRQPSTHTKQICCDESYYLVRLAPLRSGHVQAMGALGRGAVLALMATCNFVVFTFVALLGPFFPSYARSTYDASSLEIGLVFALVSAHDTRITCLSYTSSTMSDLSPTCSVSPVPDRADRSVPAGVAAVQSPGPRERVQCGAGAAVGVHGALRPQLLHATLHGS
jgi:hypothetical protein